jgi:hypothetical protein
MEAAERSENRLEAVTGFGYTTQWGPVSRTPLRRSVQRGDARVSFGFPAPTMGTRVRGEGCEVLTASGR